MLILRDGEAWGGNWGSEVIEGWRDACLLGLHQHPGGGRAFGEWLSWGREMARDWTPPRAFELGRML